MNPNSFFSTEQRLQITDAIRDAEENTSGEIRVHIERRCKSDVLDRAAFVFSSLEMHKTEKRNGVLFYLAIDDHKFAILGDAGINAVTPEDFWDNIKELMLSRFKEMRYSDGLAEGIRMAGKALKDHFPWQKDDINELPNEISYGKDNQ